VLADEAIRRRGFPGARPAARSLRVAPGTLRLCWPTSLRCDLPAVRRLGAGRSCPRVCGGLTPFSVSLSGVPAYPVTPPPWPAGIAQLMAYADDRLLGGPSPTRWTGSACPWDDCGLWAFSGGVRRCVLRRASAGGGTLVWVLVLTGRRAGGANGHRHPGSQFHVPPPFMLAPQLLSRPRSR